MDSIVIFGAKYLFIIVVLLWVGAWAQAGRRHKAEIALATLLAFIIAAVLDKAASKLYYDPRPFAAHHLRPLITHAADNGFPSEHTLFSATLAAVLFMYRPKLGALAFAVALLVGVARVAAHVHSPIDIAAGAFLGACAGYAGYLAASRILAPKTRPSSKRADARPKDPK
jgi:undecaprenyl-diphosphatase